MGFGAGVGLIAAGAVFMWGLDVDLPYIEDHTLGAVLLVAGVVALVGAALMRVQQHPETSPDAGILLILFGAILLWGLEMDIPYVSDAALGVILLVGGIATVAATVAMNRPRTVRRQVVYRS